MQTNPSKPTSCWITVNRACNLRCKWCYATDAGFNSCDDMNFEDAKSIVDFCIDLDIHRIVLIGGEPTIYPDIIELIKYISEKGIKSTLVTNGILLSNKDNVSKYLDAGLNSFSVSVKGNSQKEYLETTGSDCFEKVLEAISNLSSLNTNFSISQVLTYDNISTFSEGILKFKKAGAKTFSFSFCYNFNCGNTSKKLDVIKDNPYILADLFKQYYEKIDKSLVDCKYTLSQGLPLCVWDQDLISQMVKKRTITSICQLLSGSGILFNTNLSLIPCNAMFQIEYGKFLKDFDNKETFERFMKSNDVQTLFSHLRGIPDYKCLECKNAGCCGGGCVTNWTNYSFEELETELKNKYEEWKNGNIGINKDN